MSDRDIRERVWAQLREVAKPDSRFHFQFEEFIPDTKGSDRTLARLLDLPAYRSSHLILVTPDNCLEGLRAQAIRDNKVMIVPTYGIRRGFVLLTREMVPPGCEEYASWLDGMERFGERVSLAQIQALGLGQLDLLITGASVIDHRGVRWGKGHGYFDIEWAIMFMIKAATIKTVIVTFVDDCQVVGEELPAAPHDTICDLIVTPTRTIRITAPNKPTVGIIWEKLRPGMMEETPPLQELRAMFPEDQ